MSSQKLFVFKHQDKLGNAPAQKLFRLLEVKKNCGDRPSRSFDDYDTTLIEKIKEDAPDGVEVIEKL